MKKTIPLASRKAGALVLVLALGLASGSYAAEGIWTTKANMPTARWNLCTSVVDGKIYAIGGGPRYGGAPLRTVEAYDPATDTWTTKSEMPTARQGLSTSVVNGKIYAMGGGDLSAGASAIRAFSTVEEYDPATDTWTTKSEMPTARFGHSANVVDGSIYVIGGGPSCPWCGAILTLEVYEPATDTWIRQADIPRPIITASTSVVDGKIYAIGGEGTGGRVDEYDPVTDTWTRKADMPTPRTDLSTSVVDGKIYAIGGDGAGIVATVEVYDPATDTWTTAPDMPTARTGVSTSVANGKIYAIGGLASWGGTGLRTVEEYAPPLVVDFNGDFKVDFKDFSMLAQYWYQDQSPFVDYRMDYEYLALLAEYWLEDFRLVAHWKLDETEGFVAHDSVGDCDAFVLTANLLWRPEDGKLSGALELDGIDDCVSTPFVLNPIDGPFSVFAWIKGGAPGQVIISQRDGTVPGATWLWADPSDGSLMTELKAGRGRPLTSQTVITDGNWHHVGMTWDGSCRTLYVDDVEVAKDTQPQQLPSSDGGLYFGAGKDREPDSFFSGLIDDVKIYNRAVSLSF
jgi:N-acetylneuraminic acid mutarotase